VNASTLMTLMYVVLFLALFCAYTSIGMWFARMIGNHIDEQARQLRRIDDQLIALAIQRSLHSRSMTKPEIALVILWPLYMAFGFFAAMLLDRTSPVTDWRDSFASTSFDGVTLT
jgi:hypothetical protein